MMIGDVADEVKRLNDSPGYLLRTVAGWRSEWWDLYSLAKDGQAMTPGVSGSLNIFDSRTDALAAYCDKYLSIDPMPLLRAVDLLIRTFSVDDRKKGCEAAIEAHHDAYRTIHRIEMQAMIDKRYDEPEMMASCRQISDLTGLSYSQVNEHLSVEWGEPKIRHRGRTPAKWLWQGVRPILRRQLRATSHPQWNSLPVIPPWHDNPKWGTETESE